MTLFLQLVESEIKQQALRSASVCIRDGKRFDKTFDVPPLEFTKVPGSPFAYWISEELRDLCATPEVYDDESNGRCTRCGLSTLDNFRFLRLFWELTQSNEWVPYYHGGIYSPFYDDFPLMVCWSGDGSEVKNYVEQKVGSASRKVQGEDKYFTPGFVFPRRTRALSPKFMPAGGIYSTAGQAGFAATDDIVWTVSLLASRAVTYLISLSQGGTASRGGLVSRQFEVGLIKRLPWSERPESAEELERAAIESWRLKRIVAGANEISRAFVMPSKLLSTKLGIHLAQIDEQIRVWKEKIDKIGFDVYEFSEADRLAAYGEDPDNNSGNLEDYDSDREEDVDSWCIGISFGRFDWRLATGEREMPEEPGPFDPLLNKSPGMLPDGAERFHHHEGVLVDDPGQQHDLTQLIEAVRERVDMPVPNGIRRWLRTSFFKEHLKKYSESRRMAPIYWPLSTPSGSYTLWIYYPELDGQTLYTAVNDFLEPKLKLVGDELNSLRAKSGRSAAEERELEKQQGLQLELIELRDTILEIAPTYKPNQDDGVQIAAAPLWPLFRHKPWQKVLKDTWGELEAGDYDWAHLAYNYWPDRVRDKCKADKSLAIAHGMEELYDRG